MGDITSIWTAEGWLSLAVVIDVFSRAVVGWSMSRWLKAELVINAFAMALNQRQPQPGLIMHTDQGAQYVADRYVALLHHHGIVPSMSRKGNCWDNAVAESFFHTLKTECVYLETFETRDQAQDAIFDYIEVFYNRQRRHSANGNLAPMVYEQAQKSATFFVRKSVDRSEGRGVCVRAPGRHRGRHHHRRPQPGQPAAEASDCNASSSGAVSRRRSWFPAHESPYKALRATPAREARDNLSQADTAWRRPSVAGGSFRLARLSTTVITCLRCRCTSRELAVARGTETASCPVSGS